MFKNDDFSYQTVKLRGYDWLTFVCVLWFTVHLILLERMSLKVTSTVFDPWEADLNLPWHERLRILASDVYHKCPAICRTIRHGDKR